MTRTGRPRVPVAQRFHSRYKINPETGCWDWIAGKFSSGYGALSVNGVNKPAHRAGYELIKGPVPKELHLDHLCRNRGCVNPDHLEPVTCQENMLRGVSPSAVSARTDLCGKGLHDLNDNPYRRKNGNRQCRECQREHRKNRYRDKKV